MVCKGTTLLYFTPFISLINGYRLKYHYTQRCSCLEFFNDTLVKRKLHGRKRRWLTEKCCLRIRLRVFKNTFNPQTLHSVYNPTSKLIKTSWNVMAHAQKPYFFFRRNGRVHLNRRERQFSRLLAATVCASEVVMLDTLCSKVVWRVLATHSSRQFPLHFSSRASPCAITFQLDSTSRKFGGDVNQGFSSFAVK